MKKINLLMIDNIFMSNPNLLSENIIKNYLGIKEINQKELGTLNRLCLFLKKNMFHHSFFANYYINFKISQLDKSFDLLRVGKKSILNIEIRSQKLKESELLKQLEKNYYYLSFLDRQVNCYAFVAQENKDVLYYYEPSTNQLEIVTDISRLLKVVQNIDDLNDENIDKLFDPTNYLVSPFTTPKRFIASKYFLTTAQKQIKDEILEEILNNSSDKVFSISGEAGTGKTLLTYDIAKALMNEAKRVAIIHCAQVNEGIEKLNSDYGWNIISISAYRSTNFSSCDILIIDEAQRLSKQLFEKILEDNAGKYIIFSHDVQQKLNRTNDSEVIVNEIENEIATKSYKLKNKIRHNKKLASFIKKFYDLGSIESDNLLKKDYEDISFYYTKDINDAGYYVDYLKNLGWEHIFLTNSSIYDKETLGVIKFSARTSSHSVIGQEYDNVVITIDEHFYYNAQEKLGYGAESYYNPLETLFQAITRTRKKLTFVIVNNENVYEKCVRIVNRG